MSIKSDSNPFIVEGPVPPDSPLYIEREADRQLINLAVDGEIFYIVAPRQMGRTSLIHRTAERLRERSVRCAIVDLSTFGSASTDDEWYERFVEELSLQLQPKIDTKMWWRQQRPGSEARLQAYFEQLLKEASGETVVFIDDLEVMERDGPWQSFFQFVGLFYESRSKSVTDRGVSLILSGRDDLMRLVSTNSLRFVWPIHLTDFTLEEAARLTQAFWFDQQTAMRVMRAVFEWTGGHPYLTQRVCSLMYEAGGLESIDTVEQQIRRYFHGDHADPHLDYIRGALTDSDYSPSILKQYQSILRGQSNALEVSTVEYMVDLGLLKPGTPPQVRNRIYREVFNEKWVEEQLRLSTTTEDLFDGRDLSQQPEFTVDGRYRLERLIGRGAAGDVYLTQDRILGRSIAIRLIPTRFLITDVRPENEALKHFEDCLRAMVRVNHPNVVTIFDFGVTRDQCFYIVTEYVPGESLSRFLERNGPLSIEQAQQILDQIVNAVDAAHGMRALHGDLNPSKILIVSRPGAGNNDLSVKVGDFGMAQLLNKGANAKPSQPPGEGEVGDPVYMAPEQIVGEGAWDARADIYSLGMIAYQLFGGQVPEFENLTNILSIKLDKRFVSLRKLRGGMTEAVEQAIMRALEVDPKDRPATAREWFDQIANAIQSPQKTGSESAQGEIGDFEVPIVLSSQFTDNDPENKTIATVFAGVSESLFGGMRLITSETTDLQRVVFVSLIHQSVGSRSFRRNYYEAKRLALKTLVYIKREDRTQNRRPGDPDILPPNEFENLKKQMLTDGAARFFDTADDLAEVFSTDLTEWLTKEFLPEVLRRAKDSSPEVIAQLLREIKAPAALDARLLDEVRRRQVESTGRYWFYLSCAEEDWRDEHVQHFFEQLNAEVRALAGYPQFYVGAFRSAKSEVATTALREEWFPHTVAALQNSRVLVPLYTPGYFKSETCGKVWEFFQLRANTIASSEGVAFGAGSPPPIILPVLWTPNDSLPYPLSDAVASIQYTGYSASSDKRYSSRGLRYLMRRNKDQYEQFIKEFARRLVDVATPYQFPPLAQPPSYSQLKNPFVAATVEQTAAPLTRFSQPALRGLEFAEALRVRLDRTRISSSQLLWGLYQVEDGATRELLQSCNTEEEIDLGFQERLGVTDASFLSGLEPAPVSSLPFASFTPHGDEALLKARAFAGEALITERQLLAALLSIPQAHGTKWLSKMTGLAAEDLFDIVAASGDEEGKSIAAEIRDRLATEIRVEALPWTLTLSPPQSKGQNLNEIRVGERVTLTISLEPAPVIASPETPRNVLRIPVNSLELTGWIRAPGCQLPLEIPFTIKTIDGRPETRSFNFDLKPLLSGPRKVEVEIYPGGRVSNLGPGIVSRTLSVASPVALPDIKELIDRRQIPHPQPDVMLYIALQETPKHQQTQIYLTCAALELDREPLDPPLQLNERDIAELRTLAVDSAAKANGLSPTDGLAVLRGVGADLFDRLIKEEFEDYFHAINELAAITNRTWSWMVISDENAVLPWEMVCYYGFAEDGTIRYDDFFADKFQVSHWVGQRGLRLMNTVPMGDLDLIHYNQRSDALQGWTTALGPDLVKVESDAGQMSLLKEGSYCFGLHLLRYSQEQQTKQVVALGEKEDEDFRVDGEAITGAQKLDLTLRRPTVGLSLVSELPATTPGSTWTNTQLESSWLLPFMQAGASALFGPRWPVSVEVDQVFVKEFYDCMRHGETLGAAFFKARARVRTTFPHRTDWLAYAYFGHPHAEPYVVQPAQGFTLFEALDVAENELFVAGGTYRFRASYRTEAPAWYEGRLQIQQGNIEAQDLSVMVMPLTGVEPTYCALKPVAEGNELQGMISITMPKLEADATTNLPVMIRFQKASEELRTMVLNLQLKGEF